MKLIPDKALDSSDIESTTNKATEYRDGKLKRINDRSMGRFEQIAGVILTCAFKYAMKFSKYEEKICESATKMLILLDFKHRDAHFTYQNENIQECMQIFNGQCPKTQ